MPKQTAATLQTVSVGRTAASDVANDGQVDLSFTDSNLKATVIETQIEKFLRQARELKAPVFTTEAEAQWYLVVRYDGRIHSKVKSSDMSLSAFCFAFLREQCHEFVEKIVSVKEKHKSVAFGVDPALATPELFESVLSALVLAVSPYYNVKTSRIELDGYRFAIVSHHAKHLETGATEWMKTKANIRPPIPTCSNLTTQVGICVICRDYCHSGHDGLLVGESRTYNCECNACDSSNIHDEMFNDVFCYCGESRGTSVMIPCIFCENLFHQRCILDCEDEEDIDQFSCRDCTSRLTFIGLYSHLTEYFLVGGEIGCDDLVWENGWGLTGPKKRGTLTPQNIQPECKMSTLRHAKLVGHPHIYLTNGWMDELCRCEACVLMYKESGVLFLFSL